MNTPERTLLAILGASAIVGSIPTVRASEAEKIERQNNRHREEPIFLQEKSQQVLLSPPDLEQYSTSRDFGIASEAYTLSTPEFSDFQAPDLDAKMATATPTRLIDRAIASVAEPESFPLPEEEAAKPLPLAKTRSPSRPEAAIDDVFREDQLPIEPYRQPLTEASALLAQNVYGRYWQGAGGGLRLANPPVPGFAIDNAFIFYATDTFIESNGDRVDLGATADPVVNRTAFAWGADFKVLGGSYGAVVSVPLANLNTRPFPGVQSTFGVSDIYFQPLTLGWVAGDWKFTTSYGFWAPTGNFQTGGSRNVGRGFWTHMVAAAMTYTSPDELPWIASLMARYETHTQIRGTNIRPGDTLTLEYGVGKTVAPNFDAGLVGYAAFQTSTTTGSDFTGDPTRYRYFGLGGELQYRIPEAGMRLRLSSYFDFGALNASQGFNTIFSIAYRFR
ncbi:MAG: transporter [Spirulina sp.]